MQLAGHQCSVQQCKRHISSTLLHLEHRCTHHLLSTSNSGLERTHTLEILAASRGVWRVPQRPLLKGGARVAPADRKGLETHAKDSWLIDLHLRRGFARHLLRRISEEADSGSLAGVQRHVRLTCMHACLHACMRVCMHACQHASQDTAPLVNRWRITAWHAPRPLCLEYLG